MASDVYEEPFIIRPQADLLEQHPALKQAANALALKYAFKERVTEDELKNMGQALWQAVDAAADFDEARQRAGAQILVPCPYQIFVRIEIA